jgi:hypothetical protein
METLRDSPRAALLGYCGAAAYCGLDTRYFTNLHKEGRGPTYVKPSERRVFFTRDALDRWMATWKVVRK